MNFVFDGEQILVRTSVGHQARGRCSGAVVAFEVDDFDPLYHSGWSVVGDRPRPRGRPTPMSSPGCAAAHLPHWSPADGHVIAIDPAIVVGAPAHPRPPSRSLMMRYADVAETHSAAVFFFGDRAYKVKKPIDLGFLDFRERRGTATRSVTERSSSTGDWRPTSTSASPMSAAPTARCATTSS